MICTKISIKGVVPAGCAGTKGHKRDVDAMTGYWAAFARDGDPNGSGRPV